MSSFQSDICCRKVLLVRYGTVHLGIGSSYRSAVLSVVLEVFDHPYGV